MCFVLSFISLFIRQVSFLVYFLWLFSLYLDPRPVVAVYLCNFVKKKKVLGLFLVLVSKNKVLLFNVLCLCLWVCSEIVSIGTYTDFKNILFAQIALIWIWLNIHYKHKIKFHKFPFICGITKQLLWMGLLKNKSFIVILILA